MAYIAWGVGGYIKNDLLTFFMRYIDKLGVCNWKQLVMVLHTV